MDYNISQIQKLEAEIKRHNFIVKTLRAQRDSHRTHIYNYMSKNNIENYKGYSIKKLAPKKKTRRKKAVDKHRDAYNLCRNVGIPDPEKFIKEFKATQTSKTE